MAGLAILEHMHDLSDEVPCERWVENRCSRFFAAAPEFSARYRRKDFTKMARRDSHCDGDRWGRPLHRSRDTELETR